MPKIRKIGCIRNGSSQEAAKQPLRLVQTISMPNVNSGVDHVTLAQPARGMLKREVHIVAAIGQSSARVDCDAPEDCCLCPISRAAQQHPEAVRTSWLPTLNNASRGDRSKISMKTSVAFALGIWSTFHDALTKMRMVRDEVWASGTTPSRLSALA
jgi:hypothetical protein